MGHLEDFKARLLSSDFTFKSHAHTNTQTLSVPTCQKMGHLERTKFSLVISHTHTHINGTNSFVRVQ